MTWFEVLTGFREKSPDQVRAKIEVDPKVKTTRWPREMKCHDRVG
jgi:hypothetical protein